VEPSQQLLGLAQKSVHDVENNLKRPLEESKKAVAEIQDVAGETAKSLAFIEEYVISGKLSKAISFTPVLSD